MWDDGGPHEIPSRAACGPRAAGWTALIYTVRVNTPNRFCLIRCNVINYNDVTSATNPYVFEKCNFY